MIMINTKRINKYCCEDLSKVQNYDAAIADTTQTWDCHHKLEMFMTRKELIDIGRYYNVPARELVFLTRKEHCWWPHVGHSEAAKKRIGTHHTDEAKQKMREIRLGQKNPVYGLHWKLPQETRDKMSIAKRGQCWWNNGIKNVRAKECPKGFVKGMLKG